MPSGEKPFWFEYKGDLGGINDAIDKTTEDIRDGFFLRLFDLPANDKQKATATEIIKRIEQSLRKATPITGRLQSEYFNPVVHRSIGVLGRAGKLPDIPEELLEIPGIGLKIAKSIYRFVNE